MEVYHDHTGHLGIAQTLAHLCAKFWFPQMARYVAQYVASCDTCQRIKGGNQRPGGLLKPTVMSGEPWRDIAMDFLTDLPMADGLMSLLVVVDCFCKMLHIVPLKEGTSTQDVATAFFANVARLHGLPATIITDHDPRFQSLFW